MRKKPATEQRKEYTILGSDSEERDKPVACRILDLAMTGEACREAEM